MDEDRSTETQNRQHKIRQLEQTVAEPRSRKQNTTNMQLVHNETISRIVSG